MVDEFKRQFNIAMVLQMLVLAGVTTLASGYVSGKVVESKMEYIIQEMRRLDAEGKATRIQADSVAIRQAGAIARADEIHVRQDRRLDYLEGRRNVR